MDNCGSTLTCPPWSSAPIDADPGIVGVGVLVSFFATALLTFGAIVIGYLTDALPDYYLTTVDHDVMKSTANSRLGRWSVKAWKMFNNVLRRCLFLKPPTEDDRLSKSLRTEALKNFILTLSDQQLVTGIAVLIGGFGNWCTTSAYEMNVIVSLAWFSSATHLATLDVLRDYFQENRVVRNWRIFGMIIILLLLSAGLILTSLTAMQAPGAPLACLANHDTAGGNSTSATGNQTENYTPIALSTTGSPFDLLGVAFTMSYLLHGYGVAILRTMIDSHGLALTPPHIVVYVVLRMSNLVSEKMSMDMISNALRESRIANRRKINQYVNKSNIITVRKALSRLNSVYSAYISSYLSHIAGLFFGLSYGILQLAVHRSQVSLNPSSNRIDFGQIVPLILLALPVLAAAEIFHRTDHDKASVVIQETTSAQHKRLANSDTSKDGTSHTTVPPDWNCHDSSVAHPQILNSCQVLQTNLLPTGPDPPSINSNGNLIGFTFSVGALGIYHVIACVVTGILLNLSSPIVVLAPMLIGLVMASTIAGYVSQTIGAIDKLRTAMQTNTLDKYRHHERMIQPATQLTDLTSIPPTGSDIGDRVSLDSHRNIVRQSAPQDRRDRTNPHHDDDDGPTHASPIRQDTESGLRRQGTSTGLDNEQYARAR